MRPAQQNGHHGRTRSPAPAAWPRATAIALTAVAGSVDAIGYVTLAHVFVANMSGNSIALGLHAAQGRWGLAWRRGFPVLAFVVGLLIGGIVAEWRRRSAAGSGRSAIALTLVIEWVLLATFLLIAAHTVGWHARGPLEQQPTTGTSPPAWPAPPAVPAAILVACAATAMGVQNVCLRAAGVLSVYTTHVTGALTQLADEAVTYGLWLWHRSLPRRHRPTPRRLARLIAVSHRHPSFREMMFLVCVWSIYVLAAAAGGIALSRFGVVSVLGPLALLAVLIAVEAIPRGVTIRQAGKRESPRQRQK